MTVQHRDPLQRVAGLFGALPGVRVTRSYAFPGGAVIAFAASDQRTLARLIHLGVAINMPLQAEVEGSCRALYTHDDPGCVRYSLCVPVSAGDGPNEGLGLVEQLLAEWAQQLTARQPPNPQRAPDRGSVE